MSLMWPSPAAARDESAAGTIVTNVARLRAETGDGAVAALSNPVTLMIAERLDVALTAQASGPVVDGAPLRATLTNRGNGDEAFALVATASRGVTVTAVAIDSNGDGRFDAAVDRTVHGTTPVLRPGEAVALLVVASGRTADRDAAVTLAATAATGSGAPGTSFPGMGDGGSDAIVGATHAAASIDLAVGGDATPVLVKSQTVRAPDGSEQPVSGATVTYTLAARFPGARSAVRIDDALPERTTYVAGSLTLDDARLSDAADGDAGTAGAAGIAVALGDVPAGATHVVQFKILLP